MVNPLLTLLFDLFLIGSAGGILAALVFEQRSARRLGVGTHRGSVTTPRRALARHRRDSGRSTLRHWQPN